MYVEKYVQVNPDSARVLIYSFVILLLTTNMPPKGSNAKKEGGRAKKAENEERKAVEVEKVKAAKEGETWKEGGQ